MEQEDKRRELRQKAMRLPLSPGVYLMHNKAGEIIYIGKAKALKNRVSQYFGSEKNHDAKVRRMVSNVDWFEYILCDSEFEALVLESSLIKQNQPKYNILLKDDKGYSYIRVSGGPWPRITEVKKVEDDGARYIGPYLSSWSIKQTIDSARKIFKLPDCTRKFPQDFGKGRPCLNYYIKQCCAPCRGRVSEAEYNEAFQEALDFIKGGSSTSVKALTAKMEEAAENMEFELAARLRDRIAAINKMKERQKVVASKIEEQDVFALAQGETHTAFEVFRFTGGKLSDRESFLTEGCQPDPEARSEFLRQYYAIRDRVPPGGHHRRPGGGRGAGGPLALGKAGQVCQTPRPPAGGAGPAGADVPSERGGEHRPPGGQHRPRRLRLRRAPPPPRPGESPRLHRVLRHLQPPGRGERGGHGGVRKRPLLKVRLPQVQDSDRHRPGRLRLHAGGHPPALHRVLPPTSSKGTPRASAACRTWSF